MTSCRDMSAAGSDLSQRWRLLLRCTPRSSSPCSSAETHHSLLVCGVLFFRTDLHGCWTEFEQVRLHNVEKSTKVLKGLRNAIYAMQFSSHFRKFLLVTELSCIKFTIYLGITKITHINFLFTKLAIASQQFSMLPKTKIIILIWFPISFEVLHSKK